jgi:hypothetical protein
LDRDALCLGAEVLAREAECPPSLDLPRLWPRASASGKMKTKPSRMVVRMDTHFMVLNELGVIP